MFVSEIFIDIETFCRVTVTVIRRVSRNRNELAVKTKFSFFIGEERSDSRLIQLITASPCSSSYITDLLQGTGFLIPIVAAPNSVSDLNLLFCFIILRFLHDIFFPVCEFHIQCFFFNTLLTCSRYTYISYFITSSTAADPFHSSSTTLSFAVIRQKLFQDKGSAMSKQSRFHLLTILPIHSKRG